jgi:cystathionine beta-lyase
MDISEILNHSGEERASYFGAVSPPLFQTTNFCFPDVSSMRESLKKEMEVPFYTRGFNPTVGILRKKIAALEKAEDALVFGSGSAAIAAAVLSVVSSGDHVLCVSKPYSWTHSLLSKYLAKFNVASDFYPGGDAKEFEKQIRPETKLIYLESPNSLTFEIQDLAAIAAIAKSRNIVTIADNSYASPLNQSPISLGIDLVVHSASKYLNGHSDVVAGVVAGNSERIKKMMATEFMTLGAIISTHDAWLILRGLRTLEIRVNRSSESAAKVVSFLASHPAVEELYYPMLDSHPGSDIAKKQMCKGGGLLSMKIKTSDEAGIERFCNSLKRFLLATSWGGYESLVFPVCAVQASRSFENPLPFNLVRLYIGLENPDDLISDLKQALEKV